MSNSWMFALALKLRLASDYMYYYRFRVSVGMSVGPPRRVDHIPLYLNELIWAPPRILNTQAPEKSKHDTWHT